MAKISLGKEAKDKVTGFQGIVTGKAEYLTGCHQFLVQPKCENNGAYPDAQWLDEGRLDFVGDALTKDNVRGDGNGCDHTAPIK